jgi:hypothetical protein
MDLAAAQQAFERCGTLADAILTAHALGWEIAEVVVQDEYTHDVVLTQADRAIVLDCT